MRALALGWLAVGGLVACSKKDPPADLAAVSSAALEAPRPATPVATTLVIDAASSSVTFLMDSPLEKIDGEAPGSASGELAVDLHELSRSSGLVRIDLDKLTLYQQKRPSGSGEYQERKKSALQNEHARDWLELVPREGAVTPAQAEHNRLAEFRIEKLEPSVNNVLELSGAERKVTATATGTLRLHGRQATERAKLELTFRFSGDQLEALHVKTLEPLLVNLAKFEVHPRDSAGKLVKTITETLATTLKGKVQGDAPVQVELTAKPK